MKVPPIALGLGGGVAALVLLAPFTADALGTLRAARAIHARLGAEARQPEAVGPAVKPGVALAAPDGASARSLVLARVNGLAKAGGVLVETVAAVEMPNGVAAVRLRVSGAEKAVLAFADALERQRPAMRLRSWRIEPVDGGVRLSGEVVAPWQ